MIAAWLAILVAWLLIGIGALVSLILTPGVNAAAWCSHSGTKLRLWAQARMGARA